MDAGAALGFEETEARLAERLIRRTVMQAISELIKNNLSSLNTQAEEKEFFKKIAKLEYNR